jgi:HlyD family secretion protein
VVRLDDRELKAALAAAEAHRDGENFRMQSEQSRLAGLNTQLLYAKRQLERQQNLSETGDIARKALDDAEQTVHDLLASINTATYLIANIESSLQAAKAEINRAEDSLNKTVIRAPMDGVITALNAEVGEVVLMGTMNNPGTVIMTIADLSRMVLKAEVAESDIAKVRMGQISQVRINAYRDQVFSGTVTEVALQRTEDKTNGTGYFKVEVEIDTRGDRVLSGCQANVDIQVASFEGLRVESQAVVDRLVDELPDDLKRDNPLVDRSRKSVTVVYRMVDNKAICTPIKRGASDDTHSIVERGLAANDMVVVGPFKVLEKLKHNQAIVDERTTQKPHDENTPTPEPAAVVSTST